MPAGKDSVLHDRSTGIKFTLQMTSRKPWHVGDWELSKHYTASSTVKFCSKLTKVLKF